MSDRYTRRTLSAEELEEEFREDEFDVEDFEIDPLSDEAAEFLAANQDTLQEILNAQYPGGVQVYGDKDAGDEGDEDIESAYPIWNGDQLLIPPRWKGPLSNIDFYIQQHTQGTVLVAEIPGETTSVITTLCNDAEGLMDTWWNIDAAVSISLDPTGHPAEFLAENTLGLQLAVTMLTYAAEKMEGSMDEIFCPPDRQKEFNSMKKNNLQGARTLRAISDRVNAALTSSLPPLLNAASRESAESQTLH